MNLELDTFLKSKIIIKVTSHRESGICETFTQWRLLEILGLSQNGNLWNIGTGEDQDSNESRAVCYGCKYIGGEGVSIRKILLTIIRDCVRILEEATSHTGMYS